MDLACSGAKQTAPASQAITHLLGNARVEDLFAVSLAELNSQGHLLSLDKAVNGVGGEGLGKGNDLAVLT